MPSRKILGPRGQRDNLLATANVNGQATPIRVESDEGILSRKAMSAIGGESGLKLLNSGKMPRFSVGGAPAPDYNSGGTTKTGTCCSQQRQGKRGGQACGRFAGQYRQHLQRARLRGLRFLARRP